MGSSFGCILRLANTSHRIFMYTTTNLRPLVDIHSCEVIDGNLPIRQTKLALAWAELHQEDLLADWKLVMNGEEPFKIQPLQ
jgi:hypothetical protein